jgi:membrane protein YqaA with SNARE-associated domain
MEYLASYGLPGLFVAAFLAATILPFSSEALLILMISISGESMTPLILASAGNILGSFLNYYIGLKGDRFVLHRLLKLDESTKEKARFRFNHYGIYSLLLAWVPVIGDPLTVVAGMFRVNIWKFAILVSIGKIGRYAILVYGYSLL